MVTPYESVNCSMGVWISSKRGEQRREKGKATCERGKWQNNARLISVGSGVQGKCGYVCNHLVTIQQGWLHSEVLRWASGKGGYIANLDTERGPRRGKSKSEMTTRNGHPRRNGWYWKRHQLLHHRLMGVWIKLHLNLKSCSDSSKTLGFVI